MAGGGEAGDPAAETHEIGDLLLSVVNLARRRRIDPEAALRRPTARFRARFAGVARRARESGREVSEVPLKELDRVLGGGEEGVGVVMSRCDDLATALDAGSRDPDSRLDLSRQLADPHQPHSPLAQPRQLPLQHRQRHRIRMADRERVALLPSRGARARRARADRVLASATSSRKTRRDDGGTTASSAASARDGRVRRAAVDEEEARAARGPRRRPA